MQIMPINSSNLPKIKTPAEALTKELGEAKDRAYMKAYKNMLLPKGQQQFPGKLRHNMTILNLCESLHLEGCSIMKKLAEGLNPELKKQAEDRLQHITNILKQELSKLDINKEVLEKGLKDMLSKISKVH